MKATRHFDSTGREKDAKLHSDEKYFGRYDDRGEKMDWRFPESWPKSEDDEGGRDSFGTPVESGEGAFSLESKLKIWTVPLSLETASRDSSDEKEIE